MYHRGWNQDLAKRTTLLGGNFYSNSGNFTTHKGKYFECLPHKIGGVVGLFPPAPPQITDISTFFWFVPPGHHANEIATSFSYTFQRKITCSCLFDLRLHILANYVLCLAPAARSAPASASLGRERSREVICAKQGMRVPKGKGGWRSFQPTTKYLSVLRAFCALDFPWASSPPGPNPGSAPGLCGVHSETNKQEIKFRI